ncbi:unnamed protein product [Darwinula stevensoni]|uniref:Senescence domain-containing protein n=1 Tax=Darwinula stevensoni TaxID=69355 RepID=A0A7R8X078_9CRUS|nr:unnamed protein product [Darwinula stevensoni]CAG0881398.1 unnamed protein product [Darwinula stevensoni]
MAQKLDSKDESLHEELRNLHVNSHSKIDKAISFEEHGRLEEALALYKEAMTMVDKALHLRFDGPHCTGEVFDDARQKQREIRKARKEIMGRISCLEKELALIAARGPPPPYTASARPAPLPPARGRKENQPPPGSAGGVSSPLPGTRGQQSSAAVGKDVKTPNSLGSAGFPRDNSTSENPVLYPEIRRMHREPSIEGLMIEELLRIDNVSLYHISSNGEVDVPSYPQKLIIFRFPGEPPPNAAKAGLQIGDEWVFPLVPGQSPVLQDSHGRFLFPDLGSPESGEAYGLLFDTSTPTEVQQQFQDLIQELTALKTEDQVPGAETMAEKISYGLIKGAEFLSSAITTLAEKGSVHFGKGAEHVIARTSQNENPVKVDGSLAQTLKSARRKTLGAATASLGAYAAQRLSSSTRSYLPDDKAKKIGGVSSVVTVASGALEGFGAVYLALEKASRALASSFTDNTVKVIQHKYGDEAGAAAADTLYTVGHAAKAGHDIQNMGVKSLAKATAKETGKALVKDLHGKYGKEGKATDMSGTASSYPPKVASGTAINSIANSASSNSKHPSSGTSENTKENRNSKDLDPKKS